MNCTKCEVLLHALIDGELDAGHTSGGETHVAFRLYGKPQDVRRYA
jgi:hypothetical protein